MDDMIPSQSESNFAGGRVPADFGNVPSSNMGQSNAQLNSMWMLTSSDSIVDYEHYLRGDFLNLETKEWEHKEDLRMMNEIGIRYFVALIAQMTGKAAHLTYLDAEEINRKCLSVNLAIIDILILQEKEFAINPVNFDFIIESTMNFINFSLKRGLQGFSSDLIRDTTQQNIIHTYNDSQRQMQGQKTGLRKWLPF